MSHANVKRRKTETESFRCRTLLGGSSGRVFPIAADAKFIHIHDDESRGSVCPTPPESSCASSFVDEEPADVDVSLVAILDGPDGPLDSPSSSPQDDDDTSRMNNTIPSITHPDDLHVLAPDDMVLYLGSLDANSRDAVVRGAYTMLQQKQHQMSPGLHSGGRSVGSGRTVVSSPPVPKFYRRAQQQRMESAIRSVFSPASTSTSTATVPSSVPKPSLQPHTHSPLPSNNKHQHPNAVSYHPPSCSASVPLHHVHHGRHTLRKLVLKGVGYCRLLLHSHRNSNIPKRFLWFHRYRRRHSTRRLSSPSTTTTSRNGNG